MDLLPIEILERILKFDDVSAPDILAFSATCTRFRTVGASSEVWKVKFKSCFKKLSKKLVPLALARHCDINWKSELKKRLVIGGSVTAEISAMSPRLYQDTELSFSDFGWFDDLLVQYNPDRSYAHLYVVDTLLSLLSEGGPEENMTVKYYASKALSYVQHKLLRARLRDLWPGRETEEGPESYEEAMLVIAQWCQPPIDLCSEDVSTSLDLLAEKVLARLLEERCEHPIFRRIATDQENSAMVHLTQLPRLEAELKESLWNRRDSNFILDATNSVLYEVEGLEGNTEDYYNPENSYINLVLATKKGIPITLCLLYCCVLRRLGVLLIPANFPDHFLLLWRSHPEETGDARFTYIDAFNKGKRLSGQQVRERFPHLPAADEASLVASPGDCARRMLRNLISIGASRSNNIRDGNYTLLRNALELMMIVNPMDSAQYAFMLTRIYLQLNINHEEVMNLLSEMRDNPGLGDQVDYLLHQCQVQMAERERSRDQPTPKMREGDASFPYGDIRFWVGQVCRHRKYHYTCVIYGWDPVCTASQSWISHMGVDKLEDKDKQPFYNVLVADGSQRYAAQENLVPLATPCAIPNPELGRFFTCLRPDLGYVPNSQLSANYPQEASVQPTLPR